VLCQIVRDHFETFRAAACRTGMGCRDSPKRSHALCRAVTGVFVRAVLGLSGVAHGGRAHPAAAAARWRFIQRFGAALNLNIHVHALVLDGVYVEDGPALRFQERDSPTDDETDHLLDTIERRLKRLLARRGLAAGDGGDADRWSEEVPVLAGIARGSSGCAGMRFARRSRSSNTRR
jgi:hypothetical protein